MTQLLVEAINKTSEDLISYSNLKGGMEIQESRLNYPIAEAIMSLSEVESFGKGKVELPSIFMDSEGYVYKKDQFLAVIEYERNKGINRLVLGQNLVTEEDFINFIQTIILLEMCEDTANNQLREDIIRILSVDSIAEGTESALELAKVTMIFETMFKNGNLNPYEIDVDDAMEIIHLDDMKHVIGIPEKIKKEEIPTVSQIETPTEPETTNVNTEEQSSPELFIYEEAPPTIGDIAIAIKKATDSGIKLQSIAEMAGISNSTLSEIQNLKRTSVREKTLLKIADALKKVKVDNVVEKAEVKEIRPTAMTESVITAPLPSTDLKVATAKREMFDIDHIKQERPLIFDDEAIRNYLRKFEFNSTKPFQNQNDFIDAVIAFRAEQREKYVPQHAMLKIESKLRYVGDVTPLEMSLKSMLVDVHVLLKGPAGAGKTVIAQTMSALLNMPLYTMNGSGDSDSDIIIGSKEAANGTTYAVDGRLVEAMKNAGLFYADETNFVLADILAVINAALDHRKHIYNDNTGEDVFGHSSFRFIGAINEGYEGTRKMNEATIDRTVSVYVDYMSPKHLGDYLKNYDPGYTDFQKNVLKMNVVSDADIIMLKNIATRLQDAVKRKENPLPQEIGSIRNIEQILKMTRTMTFETAIKMIIQKYDPDIRADIAGVLVGVDRLDLKVSDFVTY